MARIEHKYLVRLSQLDRLRKTLKPYLRLDNYAAQNSGKEYTVRSIYFDTKNLDFYHEKIDGLRTRKKIRVRGYNHCLQDATVFLEIKKKKGAFIKKHRSPVGYESLMPLLVTGDVESYIFSTNGYTYATENAERFLYQIRHLALRPYILIIYEREAYYSKFNHDLRITFDKNIRSQYHASLNNLFDDDSGIPILPKHCVLEVKSVIQYPAWLSDILTQFNLKQQSVSKYALCIDSHRGRKPKLNIISNGHFRLKK